MRAFDTNLLVRILTRDDAGQVQVIDRLMDRADETGEIFFEPTSRMHFTSAFQRPPNTGRF